jgi:hypothetical protein
MLLAMVLAEKGVVERGRIPDYGSFPSLSMERRSSETVENELSPME